jgi:oxygen-independent coproporphyrinogen-3 oxidase
LERQHDFGEVIQSVGWARRAGFDNLNMDLIFGIPGQTLLAWEETLTSALRLNPDHLSLYALTIEENTPFHHWVARGLVDQPDPDLAADMYELASDHLARSGFIQYEISNWARESAFSPSVVGHPRFACRHNLQYWRNRPYLGFGAGAHGYIENKRIANVLSPTEYIRRMQAPDARGVTAFPRTPVTAQVTPISREDEIAETMMMGLRLTLEGVSRTIFRQRFDQELADVFGVQIERLRGLGLLEWAGVDDEILRLTTRGRLLGNQVFVEFI